MKRFQLIANRLLIAWGVLCAGLAIVAVVAIAYQFGPGKVSNRTASKHDVRHVLNWCKLGNERITEVLHSHLSASSFSGDHIEAHAIRISWIELGELTKNDSGAGWFRGDEVTGLLSDAMGFVEQWIPSEDIPWFLSQQELRSSEVYMYPWSIYYHGTQPTAVKLIFVKPEEKTVFYFAAKI